jgi:hypothetical protein
MPPVRSIAEIGLVLSQVDLSNGVAVRKRYKYAFATPRDDYPAGYVVCRIHLQAYRDLQPRLG